MPVDNDFSAAMRTAIAERPVWSASKIGLQMRERFWEQEGIFGGTSYAGRKVMCWQNMPLIGCGITSVLAKDMDAYTPILTQPQGRTVLAGEHASYLCGWMAGAIESGRRAADSIVAMHDASVVSRA